MRISEIQDEIIKLKKETNTVILAHSYQAREILEIADFTGDSYKLSVDAKSAEADNLIFCGVHFMAETAKILSPQKRVFLANRRAGCPMAEQMSAEMIKELRDKESDRAVVAYINTTAQLKSVCDVCVTSSSAVKIVKAMDSKRILFIPDCNLGAFVKKQVPDKDIMLLDGGCPAHSSITVEEAECARKAYPDALLLVHPECRPEVSAMADYVGSTSGIMSFAKNSDSREFIIGTENSIAEHLQYECPDKIFHPMSKNLVCADMKLTTLPDVYSTIKGMDDGSAFEIKMSGELIESAGRCINEMIRLGG